MPSYLDAYLANGTRIYSTCTDSAMYTDMIWSDWNSAYTNCIYTTATTGVSNSIWHVWVNAATNNNASVGLGSLSQLESNLHREWRAEENARRASAQLLVDEADRKAEAILFQHLTEAQRRTYREARYFELITKNGRYRIYKGWAGNIARIGTGDRELDRYCIHPTIRVPEADNLLAQKLMLELEEDRFLKVANRTPGRRAA